MRAEGATGCEEIVSDGVGPNAAAHLRRIGKGLVSAEQALQELEGQPFDLVVTDYLLSGRMDGLGVLAALPMARSRPPAILLSANHDRHIEALAIKLGAFAVFKKPFGFQPFLEICRNALGL
jgi:DNA-binding NtrC family response regulator